MSGGNRTLLFRSECQMSNSLQLTKPSFSFYSAAVTAGLLSPTLFMLRFKNSISSREVRQSGSVNQEVNSSILDVLIIILYIASRQSDGKRGSIVRFTLYINVAAKHLGKFFGDKEA